MEFEILDIPKPYTYECEPCEVRGYGNECWLCGEVPKRIGRIALPILHGGLDIADVIQPIV